MNKRIILFSGLGIGLILLLWALTDRDSIDEVALFVTPDKGKFEVIISSAGELRAENSTRIVGPEGTRDVGVFNMTILDMVPEGTVVSRGDYVADLDRTDILSRLQTAELEHQRVISQYEQAQLDSALTLTGARNNIENLEFQVEENEIALAQAIYESPAVQRQAQIELERTQRQLVQERANYITRERQAVARLREIETDLITERNTVARINTLMQQYTILAPADGMVVYYRTRNGQRRTIGSQFNAFDPLIAELPDFSSFESVTYINEVDIQKVKNGQTVTMGLDAVKGKELTGVISSVANIGETRESTNSKVFEVVIEVNQADTTLRPTMTTGNKILVDSLDDVIYIPIEAVHLYGTSHFTFKRNGGQLVMQQILLGSMNDEDVVVEAGITEEDRLLVSMPPDTTGLRKVMLPDSVIEEYQMRLEERQREQEALEAEIANQRRNAGRIDMTNLTQEQRDSLRNVMNQQRGGQQGGGFQGFEGGIPPEVFQNFQGGGGGPVIRFGGPN